jgi:hypothetical protein
MHGKSEAAFMARGYAGARDFAAGIMKKRTMRVARLSGIVALAGP